MSAGVIGDQVVLISDHLPGNCVTGHELRDDDLFRVGWLDCLQLLISKDRKLPLREKVALARDDLANGVGKAAEHFVGLMLLQVDDISFCQSRLT